MWNSATTTGYSGSPEQLIAEIREACKDIADYRPDVIEMRPDYYNFIKANSKYMETAKVGYIPYYYGIKVEVKEEIATEPIITVDNYTPSIAKNAPTREVVTVIDGSRLTMVAYRAYGHKAFWVYVYDANRDRLKRPSDVEKGMQLRIPDLPKSLVNSKDQRCLDKAYELARKYDK